MSLAAIGQVWKLSLPCTQKMVLLALADCQNPDTGQCNPRVKYIAEKGGMSLSAAEKALRSLRDANLITVTHNYRDDGSLRNSDYVLNLTGGVAPSMQLPTVPGTVGHTFNGGGHVPDELGHGPDTEQETLIETETETLIETTEDLISSTNVTDIKSSVARGPKNKQIIEVDENFRELMREAYSEFFLDSVDDIIDTALAHKAAQKYTNQQTYVRNWLRREVEGKSPPSKVANQSPKYYTPKPFDHDALARYRGEVEAAKITPEHTIPDPPDGSLLAIALGKKTNERTPEEALAILRSKGYGVPPVPGDSDG